MTALEKKGTSMQNGTGKRDATKQPRKAWVAPKAEAEKVREITAGFPNHVNSPDGPCSS